MNYNAKWTWNSFIDGSVGRWMNRIRKPLSDWMMLCGRCHKNENGKRIKTDELTNLCRIMTFSQRRITNDVNVWIECGWSSLIIAYMERYYNPSKLECHLLYEIHLIIIILHLGSKFELTERISSLSQMYPKWIAMRPYDLEYIFPF